MDIKSLIQQIISEDQTVVIKTKGGDTITKDVKKTSDVDDLKNNSDIASIKTGSGQKIKEAQEILDLINDDEGRMAKSQLYKLAKYATELHNKLKDNDQLEAWVQSKITTASDYISSIKHYLEHEHLHKGAIGERKLTKDELSKREKIVKGLKKAKSSFEKTYGKDEAKNVMYAVATKRAKNEGVKFTSKYDNDPKLKGKQKTLPDNLQKAIVSEETNPKDIVKLDIPLLIRLLEYAREDAKTDMDLHNVAENLINLSTTGQVLSMNQYNQIVNTNEAY